MYMANATHTQFEAKWAQLVTLAGQLERSAQIPLQALIAIGREAQTTLDQCERLASKSPQLEGEHEVVANLVIEYDLVMAQNQPKLTADWFTLRMSATHTPAASVSKKRAMQDEAAELAGAEPGENGGLWVGEGAAAATARCVHSAPTRANQPITHSQRALSPRATSVVNPDTSSATAPTRTLRQTTAAVPG